MFEFILLAPAVSGISPAALVGVITGLITVLLVLAKILEKKVFGKSDVEMRKKTNLTVNKNKELLEELLLSVGRNEKLCIKCYDLHNVKDGDNVPLWYVTSNLKKLIAEVHIMVSEMKKIVSDTDENSEEILAKLPELINSNQAMTLRLTDLISLLEKLASKISS